MMIVFSKFHMPRNLTSGRRISIHPAGNFVPAARAQKRHRELTGTL